jgi:hypothetical protein
MGDYFCNLHIGTPYACEETRLSNIQWYFANFSCSRKLVTFYVGITIACGEFLIDFLLQQVSHFLFLDHLQIYIS